MRRCVRGHRAGGRRRSGIVLALMCLAAPLISAPPASASGAQIKGIVTSAATSGPLENVQVCEYVLEGGAEEGCTSTDAAGAYTLPVGDGGVFAVFFDTTAEGLVPRTYYNGVYASGEATEVTVGEGQTLTGIDATIQVGGRIEGSVTDAATKAPIQGAEACAQLPAGGRTDFETHRECATTNAAGDYLIQSLPPGNGFPEGGYEVEFTSPNDYIRQFYDGVREPFQATLVAVALDTTVQSIDAELEEGGEISGVVTSQVDGEPVGEAQVCADAVAWPQYCAKTNAKGEYTIAKLPSHEYRVFFSGPGGVAGEYIGQYYKEKAPPGLEPVDVAAPERITGIDAALKAYGRISGTVTDKLTKKPIAGVRVCPPSGGCEETNAAGEYSISKLLAGTYKLSFYAFTLNEQQGTNYLSQYEANEFLVQEALKARNPEAAHITVTMGGDSVIDDELEPGGTISGKMTDAKTKKPAPVSACAEDLSTGHPEQARMCPVTRPSNGTYTIRELPPGRYRVQFGNGEPAEWFQQYYKDVDLQSEAQELIVESGKALTAIDASLIANPDSGKGAVTGRATDASTDAAIAGIEVCPLAAHSHNLAAPCVTTGAGGEYLLPGLSGGEYEFEFRSPSTGTLNYVHTRFGDGKVVEVVAGRLIPAIGAQLEQGGAIAGTVKSLSGGTGAAGVPVCAYTGAGELEECTTSETGGAYRIAGLAAGSYDVGFETQEATGAYFPAWYSGAAQRSAATGVAVETGHTANADETLFPNGHPGDGAMTGVVTDVSTHAPIRGIEVCAYPPVPEGPPPEELEGLFGTCTLTGGNGRYLLTGLAPGHYELEFSSPPNGTLSYIALLYQEGAAVTVAAEQVTSSLDAQLQAGASISGTVTSAAAGQPLSQVLVCAFTGEEASVGGCAPTTASGAYTITGLLPGTYVVGFQDPEGAFAVQYYKEAAVPGEATPIAVSGGDTVAGIDARLQAGSSIDGTVRDAATGEGMAEVAVCALTATDEPVACALSAGDGSYEITGLPAGSWRVDFDAGRLYQIEYWDEVTEFAAATPLPLTPGQTIAGIDAAIKLRGAPGPPVPPTRTTPTTTTSTPPATSQVLGSVTTKAPPSVVLLNRRATLLGSSSVAVRLNCSAAPCRGVVTLTEKIRVKLRNGHRRTETIVLARGSFSLVAGTSATVRLRLTAAGRRRLAGARRHPVGAGLAITVSGAAAQTDAVRVG